MFFANPRVRPGAVRRQLKKPGSTLGGPQCGKAGNKGTCHTCCLKNTKEKTSARQDCLNQCIHLPDPKPEAPVPGGMLGVPGSAAGQSLVPGRVRNPGARKVSSPGVPQKIVAVAPPRPPDKVTVAVPSRTVASSPVSAAASGVRVPGMPRSQRRAARAAVRGGRVPSPQQMQRLAQEKVAREGCPPEGCIWVYTTCWPCTPTA